MFPVSSYSSPQFGVTSPAQASNPLNLLANAAFEADQKKGIFASAAAAPAVSSLSQKKPVLLRELLKEPDELLDGGGFIRRDMFPEYSYVRECPCLKFNRHVDDTPAGFFRDKLIGILISSIKEKYPDKNQVITITSLGSGGCFQELVLLAKLVAQEGYTHIRLNLIDQGYRQGAQIEGSVFGSRVSYNEFVALVKREIEPFLKGCKIEINGGDDVQQYMRAVRFDKPGVPKPNVLLMIDFDTGEFLIDRVIDVLAKDPRTSGTILAYTKKLLGFCLTAKDALEANIIEKERKSLLPREPWGLVLRPTGERMHYERVDMDAQEAQEDEDAQEVQDAQEEAPDSQAQVAAKLASVAQGQFKDALADASDGAFGGGKPTDSDAMEDDEGGIW